MHNEIQQKENLNKILQKIIAFYERKREFLCDT